jgi:aryl-alcohol dehydrogenase-like predicted oxidoreductase
MRWPSRRWPDRVIPDGGRIANNLVLPTNRMGLGLAALGRPGYINLGHATDLGGHTDEQSMERQAHAVLDAAYAQGVRYFDAARSYGKAEAFLAAWLRHRNLGPPEVTVGSKWGYTYTADWRVDAPVHEVKDLSLTTLTRQLGETRSLLGSNLGLYQIHSATTDSGVLNDRAVLDELAELRAGGLSIGLSVTGPGQAKTIEQALEVGGFDTVQATWNLLERSAGPALEAAHAAGLAVIVKEALANGRLTARGHIAALEATARQAGCTPDALALAAALAQPWVNTVLSGAATVPELTSNLVASSLELGSVAIDHLDSIREDSLSYWSARGALPWN